MEESGFMADRKSAGTWGALAAAGWLLFNLLKIFKFAKLAKVMTSAGSMLLSVAAYALVYGWRYAAGFVLLLFCHELGHYVAARQRGLNVGLPTFVPFVGAWVELKDGLPDARTEAIVGVAGPLLGTTAAVICYAIALLSGSELMLALAYAGFFLNLFNLIPLSPLDGGRVTAVISPRIWLVGIPVLVGLFFYRPSPLLIMIAVLAIPQVLSIFQKQDEDARRYYDTPLGDRIGFAMLYLLLVAFLAYACQGLHAQLEALHCARATDACLQ